MKNYSFALVVIALLWPAVSMAQQNTVDQFMTGKKGLPGFYYLDLETNLMLQTDSLQVISGASKELRLKLLTFDQHENSLLKAQEIYESFFSLITRSDYKGLVEIKSTGDHAEMLIKQAGDKISEMIFALQGENEITLIVISGNFNLTDLARLSALKHCKSFELLNALCEE